jgi:hypothetical protein
MNFVLQNLLFQFRPQHQADAVGDLCQNVGGLGLSCAAVNGRLGFGTQILMNVLYRLVRRSVPACDQRSSDKPCR